MELGIEMRPAGDTGPRVFSKRQFGDRYNVSLGTVDREIAAGRLEVVRARRRVLIPVECAEAWLRRLRDAV